MGRRTWRDDSLDPPADIERTALILIHSEGKEAALAAAQCADIALNNGAIDAYRLWRAVYRKIVELQRAQRAPERLN